MTHGGANSFLWLTCPIRQQKGPTPPFRHIIGKYAHACPKLQCTLSYESWLMIMILPKMITVENTLNSAEVFQFLPFIAFLG